MAREVLEQRKDNYTTGLAKGQGMIPETVTLLQEWRPGMGVPELKRNVIEKGLLSRATAYRVNDIVGRVFASRFLGNGQRPARHLKHLLEEGVSPSRLSQILLIYTARANDILHDFITEVYWPRYSAGVTTISRRDALEFLERAANLGLAPRSWSETMKIRVARYLTGCLTDFRMAGEDRAGTRELIPFRIEPATTLYLAHALHFAGLSDNAVLEHPDWKLFGLSRHDTVGELRRVSRAGRFIVQYSGDLLRISWGHPSMEDFLRDLARQDL